MVRIGTIALGLALALLATLHATLLSATAAGKAATADSVQVSFTIDQDRAIYEDSDYGEAPQVAIWLENLENGEKRTVYVTWRTATGRFAGKVDCPVSLPSWVRVWREESGKEGLPSPRQEAPEAVTRATGDERIEAGAVLPRGGRWRYYIELNVAGDFNDTFPVESPTGVLDRHGNGQPSLVWSGVIAAEPGGSSTPEPLGRTEQHQFADSLTADLSGMDSALKVFTAIRVACLAR